MRDTNQAPTKGAELSFLAGGGEMGARIRVYDWGATPLGPADGWPHSLRTAVRIMLTSRQPIWIGWGPQLIYLYNDAYQSIIGGKHPWALGRPTAEVWREIWPEIGPMLATAMEGVEGTYVEEQLLIMERNGYPEETYYTFSYSPIPDDDGAPGGIICANTDDTQRVIGERQLAALRELAAETVDARTWSQVCKRSVETLARNPRDVTFALLYMAPPESPTLELAAAAGVVPGAAGAPQALAVTAKDPWPAAQVMADHELRVVALAEVMGAAAPGGTWERSSAQAAVLAIPPSGETGRSGLLVLGLNPFRLLDEAYRGFLGLVAGQIAAAVASADAYEEERRRVEALAELDRAKTAFFSNVSHEFRTPLTLMLGPLEEVLSEHVDAAHAREQVEIAHRNGLRLLRLVNSLLDFSRIEAGRARAVYRPTDLGRFSAEIASSFHSAIEKAGLKLKIDCEPLPHPVHVDGEMWEKVLLNLISNAFKFTLDGQIGLSVASSSDGRTALVTVSDTGIGIPQDEIPKLFERFHRVEGAQGRSFEGSGIGLALVHELVSLHGGEISVESAPGRGTAFTVALPYGRRHLPDDQVREEAEAPPPAVSRAREYVDEALRWIADTDPAAAQPAAADGPHGGVSSGVGKRVLLADDSADMRGYVARLLEAQGYAVLEAGDGEAALAVAKAAPPDLILTDVMMPKLDGFGFLRAIRAEPTLAGVPVIMLSARAGEEAKVEGLEAGADDYLIKPFAARELLARINANIQMAEVRREANRAVFQSEQRLLISQDRLSLALSTGRVSVFEWDFDAQRLAIQGPLAAIADAPPEKVAEGLPLDAYARTAHPEDRERVMAVVKEAVERGSPYEVEYRIGAIEAPRVVIARGKVEQSASGARQITGVMIDVTEERAVSAELVDQTRALQILNRAAAAISGDLDLDRVVQTIVDAGVEVTGAQFGAFFYNVTDAAGERYTLYSLSGAPREAFARFPMPRNTQVFAPTFEGAGVVRSDNIRKDPRYGRSAPHYGQPKGHLPVVSYLAAPVKSRSGEVLGGLFFGHADEGVFDAVSEERIVGLAAQAAVAMDNANLFQAVQRELAQRARAEAELQALNASLEERVAEEVAQRAQAEEALRQAQKMEAVGQLTGGVAHDFNNLLTVIIGGLDTIRRARPEDEARIRRAVDMALQGAQRAANLTTRLLAFSRRQPLQPKPLDLNHLVRDMTDLLHRSLGEQVELEGVLAPRLWTIEVDQNQLEAAILNLAVNARDAMPDGGKLTIETANTALDETYAALDAEVVPGQYVMVSVSDTGAGMSKDTLGRAFEPFFTTKEVGRGTGLGLSMVYGFVKQSGGHVTIYSEVGHGTAVKLYFPRYLGGTPREERFADLSAPRGSKDEIVLLVEDNDDVRAYSAAILSELGYGVLQAAHAESALAILRSNQRIDLLFTDVVLPGPSGRVLADTAKTIRPDLKVLFTTGYSRNAIVHHGRLDAGVQLITKPFTYEQLATRVRDLLDREGAVEA